MIKVISFDIFQTLVDVNKRIPYIWKTILKNEYSEKMAYLGAKEIVTAYSEVIPSVLACDTHFYTMREVYLNCAARVIDKLKLSFSKDEIVDALFYEHSQAPFFEDVLTSIQQLKNKYSIVLSSDSAHAMVDTLIQVINPKKAYISDDIKSYKASKDQKFFSYVLEDLKIQPNEILHIGDSSQDIIGAHALHIPSVWLNRDNRVWTCECDCMPDYEIHSLDEVRGIVKRA